MNDRPRVAFVDDDAELRNANQGVIQIFGANGQDESGGYSASSSMEKKLRVVSTFEFDLK